MLGRRQSEPLLTISPEDLERLQELTKQIVTALNVAAAEMQASLATFAAAAKQLERANVELRKTRQKRDTLIRNH